VVVAVETQDTQAAKEAFRGDAVADSVGNADATHTAGTMVVEALLEGTKLIPKEFFKALNAAVVDLMRLQTSASEVRE
jgi:hypothetical protein